MKKLNHRERDLAFVTADLFLKGSPELRIAEYAHLKGFTNQQFSNFLDKLECLPEDVLFVIHTHFKDLRKGICHDKSRAYGTRLRAIHSKQLQTSKS